MNRRDFMKWIGRLLAAIPFVALADLETEAEPAEIPFKLVPADEAMRTTVTPGPMIAIRTITGSSTDMIIEDNTEWGTSPVFQFWHEGTVLWGSANGDDLSLKPVWIGPDKNYT